MKFSKIILGIPSSIIIALGCFITSLAQSSAYINVTGNKIEIGNKYIERIISLVPEKIGTEKIINKVSQQAYNVISLEFELIINFGGFGPAYGKKQNGENPSKLSSNDFEFLGYTQGEYKQNGKRFTLKFKYENYLTSILADVNFIILPDNFYIRKYIELEDESEGIHWLDRISVENITFESPDFDLAAFGQPVFYNDIFLGVEYPAVENIIEKNNVKIGYIVGEKITNDPYRTYSSVIGVASSAETIRQAFLNYVDEIKVNGTRAFLLYNSWYDFRNPDIVSDDESIMNVPNVLRRIETFKNYMYEKYNINLDAFVLDDGWDKYQSIWEIDSLRFPAAFNPFIQPLKEMNTSLGIWASPFCGYSNREKRVNWASSHGYERVGEFLCFAGSSYKKEFKKKMVQYTSDYNIGYFKWDGFLLACNEPDHGHLQGIYSRTALIQTYIDMMQTVREVNPDIFINITVGSWLSPWWLQYADCIWMQGEDYAYAEEVPSLNPRDKSITYRDAILWDDLQNQNLLFPMSSLMTHGIIKGRLNFLGGKNESLLSFSNEVTMYFGRGVMMWELYVSPDLLNENEWNVIASAVKWAKKNKDILSNTKMILGNPLKREVYGYSHLTGKKGILLIRNPSVHPQEVKINLTNFPGEISDSEKYYVKKVYPYNFIYPKPVASDESIDLTIDSYQVLTIELIPESAMDSNLPIGIRYSSNSSGEILEYEKNDFENNMFETNVSYGDDKVTISTLVTLPGNANDAKIAFLVEPDRNVDLEDLPAFQININDKIQDIEVETENYKWFWISSELKDSVNDIQFSFDKFSNKSVNVEVWMFNSNLLIERKTGKNIDYRDEPALFNPYPANVEKSSYHITSFKIE